jgi:hypothetical protein
MALTCVARLAVDDTIAIAAYVGSLEPWDADGCRWPGHADARLSTPVDCEAQQAAPIRNSSTM